MRALALAVALVACAPTLPPPAPSPYDGAYVGTLTLLSGSAPGYCYWYVPPSITVRDGRFTAELDGAPMTVPIRPDGTFEQYGTQPVYSYTKYQSLVHVVGRIEGDRLEAIVRDPRCNFGLAFVRR